MERDWARRKRKWVLILACSCCKSFHPFGIVSSAINRELRRRWFLNALLPLQCDFCDCFETPWDSQRTFDSHRGEQSPRGVMAWVLLKELNCNKAFPTKAFGTGKRLITNFPMSSFKASLKSKHIFQSELLLITCYLSFLFPSIWSPRQLRMPRQSS